MFGLYRHRSRKGLWIIPANGIGAAIFSFIHLIAHVGLVSPTRHRGKL